MKLKLSHSGRPNLARSPGFSRRGAGISRRFELVLNSGEFERSGYRTPGRLKPGLLARRPARVGRPRYRVFKHALGLAAGLLMASPCFAAEPPPLPPLTSVPNSPRLPGKFVWADLVTDDVQAARQFYGQLFNWTFRDMGGYFVAANDERPVCGIFHRSRPTGRPEATPRWFGYISVGNVEKAQRSVTEAGGRVLAAPRKLPGRGEQAVFADSEGALFGVVKSSAGDPPDFLADPGDWIWIQLLTRDAKKASGFYSTVAGYEIIENAAAGRLSDYVLASKGYARATVRTIPAGKDKTQPTWLPFVRVKSIGEAVAQAKRLGGKVLVEPKPELIEGKAAVISDPTGAAIGILEWSEALMKGGR